MNIREEGAEDRQLPGNLCFSAPRRWANDVTYACLPLGQALPRPTWLQLTQARVDRSVCQRPCSPSSTASSPCAPPPHPWPPPPPTRSPGPLRSETSSARSSTRTTSPRSRTSKTSSGSSSTKVRIRPGLRVPSRTDPTPPPRRRPDMPALAHHSRLPARPAALSPPAHRALHAQLPAPEAAPHAPARARTPRHRLQALAARAVQEGRRVRVPARVQPPPHARVLVVREVWLLFRRRRMPVCTPQRAPHRVPRLQTRLLQTRCVRCALVVCVRMTNLCLCQVLRARESTSAVWHASCISQGSALLVQIALVDSAWLSLFSVL